MGLHRHTQNYHRIDSAHVQLNDQVVSVMEGVRLPKIKQLAAEIKISKACASPEMTISTTNPSCSWGPSPAQFDGSPCLNGYFTRSEYQKVVHNNDSPVLTFNLK